MNPTLAERPSIQYLKKQAKDLLRAQRTGDASGCRALRHLRRFSNATDAAILGAKVMLHEAQFALALDYGFVSWAELRRSARRQQIIDALAGYRIPGSPMYEHQFRGLPEDVICRRDVRILASILRDTNLPPKVREHAAGALGEIGDAGAVGALVSALTEPKLRRGAAVALGRMKAARAAHALRELAPNVKAARWALSQLDVPATADEIVQDLREGHLRLIGRKTGKLDATAKNAVADKICRAFSDALLAGTLDHSDRWMVTALQFLNPPQAGDLIARGLVESLTRPDWCVSMRNRLMRAAGEIRPAQAVPALIDVICQVDNPTHKQLAAVCVEKIVAGGDPEAAAALGEQESRVRDELWRLKNSASDAPRAVPDKPGRRVPGSPGWIGSLNRAIGAVDRLLALVRT